MSKELMIREQKED